MGARKVDRNESEATEAYLEPMLDIAAIAVQYDEVAVESFAKWMVAVRGCVRDEMKRHEERSAHYAAQSKAQIHTAA